MIVYKNPRQVNPWGATPGMANILGVTLKKENVDELPPDELDTMLEDRQAPFRVARLGSMVDCEVE